MTGGSDSWKLEKEHLYFPDGVSVPEDAVSLSDGEGRGDAGPYADPKSQISNVYNQIWEAYGADAPR